MALWVVDVSEVDPPKGAEPVHWRLLTTHKVTTPAEAHQIVEWYRRRWIIEQVFRSLKSHGMDIEASQMVEAACFTKLAVIALIAAVGAMQLVLARDSLPGGGRGHHRAAGHRRGRAVRHGGAARAQHQPAGPHREAAEPVR